MACATDTAGVIGRGCRPGMAELARYMRERWSAGSLGCFNPGSLAGGAPSLHADGRAEDVALNANDAAQRARGDDLMNWLVRNADRLGVQEILWRGFIWSCRRRSEGIRFGVQQAAHMNHVHVGVGYHTANNFDRSWLQGIDGGAPSPAPIPPQLTGETDMFLLHTPEGEPARAVLISDSWAIGIPGGVAYQLAARNMPHAEATSAVIDAIAEQIPANYVGDIRDPAE